MAVQRTLSIIKPDAVAKNVIGEIYARFEKAGLKVIAARMERRDIILALGGGVVGDPGIERCAGSTDGKSRRRREPEPG